MDKLTADRLGERSEAIRARVEAARKVQRARFADTPLSCNADMGPTEVRAICQLDAEGRGLIKAAMHQLGMSARAFEGTPKEFPASSSWRARLPTWAGARTSKQHI